MSHPNLPAHLSFSQVSTMQRCGEQYRLERLERVPSRPSWATTGGSAVHTASEEWDWSVIKDGDWNTDHHHLDGLFQKHMDLAIAANLERNPGFTTNDWRASGRASKANPDKENEKWWRENGPSMLARWVTWRTNNAWEIAEVDGPEGPEWGIELTMTVNIGGVPAQMAIDRLMVRDGVYLILDLKSGSYVPDDATQLAVYKIGLETAYGISPEWGTYWMARDGGNTPPADLTKWPRERVDFLFYHTRQDQLAGKFIPKKSNMCSGCSVRDYCLTVGGESAHLVDQPWTNFAPPLASSSEPVLSSDVTDNNSSQKAGPA